MVSRFEYDNYDVSRNSVNDYEELSSLILFSKKVANGTFDTIADGEKVLLDTKVNAVKVKSEFENSLYKQLQSNSSKLQTVNKLLEQMPNDPKLLKLQSLLLDAVIDDLSPTP